MKKLYHSFIPFYSAIGVISPILLNAGFCQLIGNTLPPCWQAFAIELARPCQHDGKIQAIIYLKEKERKETS
nr:hypothetical protein [Bacteroides intestinalis]